MSHNHKADSIYSLDYNSEKIIWYYLAILLWFPSIFIPGVVYFMLLLSQTSLFLLLPDDDLTWEHKAIEPELLRLHTTPLTTNLYLYPEIDVETMSLIWMNEWPNESMSPTGSRLFLTFQFINIWCHGEYVFYDYDMTFPFSRL